MILRFLLIRVLHLLGRWEPCLGLDLALPEVRPCVLVDVVLVVAVAAAAVVVVGVVMVRNGTGLADAVLRLGGRVHLRRGGR